MAYQDFLREDMRLVILRILAELPAYRANSSILVKALERFGFTPTRDSVKTEILWLHEQGFVNAEDIGPVLVATLTERGADIASGRARAGGISRPSAGG